MCVMCSRTCLVVLLTFGFSFEALGQKSPADEKLLIVWTGMLPIILSAPHGGRQPIPDVPARRGVGVAQFTTGRDNNTDELAEKVAAKLEARFGARPFLVVALFERKYVDANRPSAGAYESDQARPYYESYHRLLRDACDGVRRKWGAGLLLDIHGQGSNVDTIYRGTSSGKTVKSLAERFGGEAIAGPGSIFGQMEQKGYKVFPPMNKLSEEARYNGGYIVRTYGSHQSTGIDTIQLELGTTLRHRAVLDRTAADLADAIAVFAREYLPADQLPSGSQIHLQR
jgi:N-formylglutamate amidohydrolase